MPLFLPIKGPLRAKKLLFGQKSRSRDGRDVTVMDENPYNGHRDVIVMDENSYNGHRNEKRYRDSLKRLFRDGLCESRRLLVSKSLFRQFS